VPEHAGAQPDDDPSTFAPRRRNAQAVRICWCAARRARNLSAEEGGVMRIILAAVTLLAVASSSPQAPSSQFSAAGIDDPKLVDRFLSTLQEAVASDDAAHVAALGRYPIEVVIQKHRRRLKTREELQKLYPQIFTDCLKRVVAAAQPESLMATGQGVMLGQGAIWFGMQGSRRMQFFTINGPIDGEPLCNAPAGPAAAAPPQR
jgi:hypothetical protein